VKKDKGRKWKRVVTRATVLKSELEDLHVHFRWTLESAVKACRRQLKTHWQALLIPLVRWISLARWIPVGPFGPFGPLRPLSSSSLSSLSSGG
jgi:hypothetical protein